MYEVEKKYCFYSSAWIGQEKLLFNLPLLLVISNISFLPDLSLYFFFLLAWVRDVCPSCTKDAEFSAILQA